MRVAVPLNERIKPLLLAGAVFYRLSKRDEILISKIYWNISKPDICFCILFICCSDNLLSILLILLLHFMLACYRGVAMLSSKKAAVQAVFLFVNLAGCKKALATSLRRYGQRFCFYVISCLRFTAFRFSAMLLNRKPAGCRGCGRKSAGSAAPLRKAGGP